VASIGVSIRSISENPANLSASQGTRPIAKSDGDLRLWSAMVRSLASVNLITLAEQMTYAIADHTSLFGFKRYLGGSWKG
jgi:hypothetical protein